MKTRILFVERKQSQFVSIEKIFRQIERNLKPEKFTTAFQQVPYSNDVLSVVKNLLFFRADDADIYHLTGHVHYITLLLPKKRTVLTIHDLAFLHTRKGVRRLLLKKLLLDWPLRRLKYVTAVSQKTKDEILEYFPEFAHKIRVIENPLGHKLSFDQSKLFDANCPTILQVGTMTNKNVPNLIRALDGISCKLRIIGPPNNEIRSALAFSKIKHENVEGLGDEQMANEYRDADIIAFCSTYEGFGLPIIEGQAYGKPIVTSNIRPLADVAGAAADLVDPNDPASINAAIKRIIEDSKHREELVRRGFENVRRFDAKSIALQYEELYDEMAAGVI